MSTSHHVRYFTSEEVVSRSKKHNDHRGIDKSMLTTNSTKHHRSALELKGTIINCNQPLVDYLKGLKIKKYYQMKFI